MGRKLFDLVFKMKNFGVGTRFTRSVYDKYPGTYWTITRIKPSTKDGNRAKVWGTFTFQGRPVMRQGEVWEKRVRSPLKPQWRVVEES